MRTPLLLLPGLAMQSESDGKMAITADRKIGRIYSAQFVTLFKQLPEALIFKQRLLICESILPICVTCMTHTEDCNNR